MTGWSVIEFFKLTIIVSGHYGNMFLISTNFFFFGGKNNFIEMGVEVYRKIGGQVNKRSSLQKQKQTRINYQWSKAFQSFNILEREISLKWSFLLHQIEAKRLVFSHKTCLPERLSLKIQELCANQLLQTVAYITHFHKHLVFFLSPDQQNFLTWIDLRLHGTSNIHQRYQTKYSLKISVT